MTAHNPDKSAAPPPASTKPADVLRIQVERGHNGHTAQRTVLLHRSAAPDAGESPHTKLAGTRAWLALGEARLAAGDAPAAVACAQAGIQELGKRYAAHTVVDDTGMKLRAAEEQLQKATPKTQPPSCCACWPRAQSCTPSCMRGRLRSRGGGVAAAPSPKHSAGQRGSSAL